MYFRSENPRPATERHTSIFRRALLHFIVLCVAVTLTLTAASFLVVRSIVLSRTQAQTSALAASAEDGIEQDMGDARQRASLLAGYPEIRDIARGAERAPALGPLLASRRAETPSMQGITVLNASGRVAASAGVRSDAGARFSAMTLITGNAGWEGFDVSVPVRSEEGEAIGWLLVRHDAAPLQMRLTAGLSSLGKSAMLLLGVVRDDDLMLLIPASAGEPGHALILGDLSEQVSFELPLAFAMDGREGMGEAEDHRGHRVIAAYRSLPNVGGALTVQVDRAEVTGSVRSLAFTLLSLGVLLFLLAVLIALLLARSLARPLVSLAEKVGRLGPGSWSYEADIRTGDEVQVLDFVMADMAFRLKSVYDDLETEIQARTKSLQEQFAFDRTILDSIQHGIVAVDSAGRISAVNPAAIRILGRSAEQLLDARPEDVIIVRKGAEPLPEHPILHVLETRLPFHPEAGAKLCIVAADGTAVPAMILAAPLMDDEKLFGAVMVFQDVRDERLMDELKSEFITLASHQLRTPLSILAWQMDVLKGEEGLTETAKGCVEEMEHANTRMTALLNALLKVAQLEGGQLDPQIEALDICSIARDVTDELSPIAEKRKVHFSLACPARALQIASDGSLLRIVLHNLLTNAVKYTRDGTDVGVIVRESAAGVEILVSDNGLGIPEQEQRLLFTKFFRGRNIRTVDTDGNGLGLYIIKMIVEGLGGNISFVSEESKGSVFTVHLPLQAEKKART